MDYVTKNTALTATADAIREKTGNTDPITWLEELGFSEAIAAIEAGAGMVLPPEITDFAVDAHTETQYGVSSCVCGHSLGVKPTVAILISAEPRYVASTDKSYIDACFAFGSGCVSVAFSATGKFDGSVTYANLGSPSTGRKNSQTEMTESKVTFSFNGSTYSQSFVLITMRWGQE